MAVRPAWFYIGAAAAGALLSVPALNFVFLVATRRVGLLMYMAVGVIALAGWFAALALWAVGRPAWTALHVWLCALIVHAGISYAPTRWSEVAFSSSAKDEPYLDVFFLRAYVSALAPGLASREGVNP